MIEEHANGKVVNDSECTQDLEYLSNSQNVSNMITFMKRLLKRSDVKETRCREYTRYST